MQNSSSTKFPTFPSGSPRASSLATSSCPGTHLTSATFTSTSQTTGRFLQHAPPFRVLSPVTAALPWFLWASRSLNVDMEWLYGASESSNMEVDIGYLPQVGLSPSLCLVLGLSEYIFSFCPILSSLFSQETMLKIPTQATVLLWSPSCVHEN